MTTGISGIEPVWRSIDGDGIVHKGDIDENYDWKKVGLGVDDFRLDAKFVNDRTIHRSHSWESTVTEWEQVRKIGQGGFATVFLQKEVGKEKFRAVKRIQRLRPSHSERELNVLIQARGYKDLFVEFLSWYEDERNDFTYLVMEYMPHGDLKQYIQRFPEKSKESASEITRQLLQGLKVLHGKGIVHRDLKPQNVLIDSLSPIAAKLSDFGVSRVLTEDKSMTIIGSRTYMAPEMLGFLPPFRPLRSPFKDGGYTTFDPQSPKDAAGRLFLEEFCSGKADFSGPLKQKVSNRAVCFVKRLLVADPASRITVANALDFTWLLEFPNEVFQESEAMRHQFMSLGSQLGLKANHKFMLACKSCSDEDTITPILLSLAKWEILLLLYTAAAKGYKSIIEMLSRYMRGKSMEVSLWPFLCLQVAAECGQIEVVRLLLGDTSIDINSILLPHSLFNDMGSLNERLRFLSRKFVPAPNHFGGRTLLQAAAGGGHVELAELLVSLYKADVNAMPNKECGRTALQAAAEGGYIELVRRLISHGADVNAQPSTEHGRTALQAAAGGGHIDLVKLLISSYNADASAKPCSRGGRTALQAAAEGGYTELVELLISHHADVHARPCISRGRTTLQAAAGGGHIELVKLLISHGADVNDRPGDMDGRTVLQAAAEGGYIDLVKLLISSYNASVNAEPCRYRGRTALQAAAEGGHVGVIKFLVSHKADVNAKPGRIEGITALKAAKYGGHTKVKKLLRSVGATWLLGCEHGSGMEFRNFI